MGFKLLKKDRTTKARRGVVSTAHGEFRGRTGDPDFKPSRGEQVQLSIRPECFSLTAEKPASNFLTGKLTESVYLGEIAQYALNTGAEPGLIHIAELNPRRVVRDTEHSFFASASPEDVVIVP